MFFFFFCLVGADFWCVFRPFSRGGSFGLHSTWTDYSSSYGRASVAKCEEMFVLDYRGNRDFGILHEAGDDVSLIS